MLEGNSEKTKIAWPKNVYCNAIKSCQNREESSSGIDFSQRVELFSELGLPQVSCLFFCLFVFADPDLGEIDQVVESLGDHRAFLREHSCLFTGGWSTKLWKVPSRLYQSRFPQLKTYFCSIGFFEIYNINTLLHGSKLKSSFFFVSLREVLVNFLDLSRMPLNCHQNL